MEMKKYDVFGIGNPLIDILIQVDESHLIELNLKKGVMHLVDNERANELFENFKHKEPKIIPAGDVTNTMMGIANLGGKCVMCGKIGRDDKGDVYEDVLTKENVVPKLIKCNKNTTGQVINFITPDSERTMATHLGAAVHLEKNEVFDEDIKQSKAIYLTGYMLENPKLRETSLHAIKIARENNIIVAVDLADPELIKRNLDDLKRIVREFVDILFVNEFEAEAFTNKKAEEAMDVLKDYADTCIVKLGSKGSLIYHKGKKVVIEPFEAKAVDTTGAGDLYAAGFLYGLTQSMPVEKCGKIGSFVSSRIVSQIGAKLSESLSEEVNKL